ncbi:hypothetical protein GCM10009554_44040 [Kribbella koreensis]|uniref:Uncharacterized protein n=1 Tax=Kribbella koreensis TaxID=57909 RepID=A0ABN1QTW2_9ACTN
MRETVVGAVMTRSPVTVTPGLPFKPVACALLASDAGAVPVAAADRRWSLCVLDDMMVTGFEVHSVGLAGVSRRRRT